MEAIGTIDELNSGIGVAMACCDNPEILGQLRDIQRLLFIAGADMANDLPKTRKTRLPVITKEDTAKIESSIGLLLKRLPKLTNFILPGGGEVAAQLHLARSVCRRAERRIVSARRAEEINPELLPFFNRLSTLLFDLARYANIVDGKDDVVWSQRKNDLR
jgi:cob(I)alamin adenosyltransferase